MSLEQLQKIRARRLEKQITEAQVRKSAVMAAEANLAQTHQDLEQFRQWRLNHQEDLFRSLQGQSCSPQAMVEYRSKLDILVVQEEQLRAAIPAAQKLLEQTHEQLLQAKKAVNALAMKNEKTKEIIETLDKADAKLAEGREVAQQE